MLNDWLQAIFRVVVEDVLPWLRLRYQRPLKRVAPWTLLSGSLWAASAFQR